jgi:hypothetical protein
MIKSSKRLGQFSEWVRKTREEQGTFDSGRDLLSLLGVWVWHAHEMIFLFLFYFAEKANKGDSKHKLTDDEIRAQIGYVNKV